MAHFNCFHKIPDAMTVMLLTAMAAKGSCPEVMGKKWLKMFLSKYKTLGRAVSIAIQGDAKPLEYSSHYPSSTIQFQIVPRGLKNPWAQYILQGDFFPWE